MTSPKYLLTCVKTVKRRWQDAPEQKPINNTETKADNKKWKPRLRLSQIIIESLVWKATFCSQMRSAPGFVRFCGWDNFSRRFRLPSSDCFKSNYNSFNNAVTSQLSDGESVCSNRNKQGEFTCFVAHKSHKTVYLWCTKTPVLQNFLSLFGLPEKRNIFNANWIA